MEIFIMKTLFANILSLLKRTFPTLFSRVALTAVITLPLIYSALYLYAFWDPYNKIRDLPVAFVNQDQGFIKNSTYRNLGNELENELHSNTDLKWSFITIDQADAGLQNKIYYSYILIPANFTRTVMSVDGDNPQKANVVLKTREATNVISARIVNRAAYEISQKLGHKISEEYFNNIFVDSRTSADDLKKAVDGAQKLANGLSDAQTGSLELKNGLNDAAQGGSDLNKGLKDAYQGGYDVKAGVGQAYDGSADLNTGLKSLSDGAASLSIHLNTAYQGALTVQSGLHTLLDKDHLPKILGGVTQMKGGADQIAALMKGVDPSALTTGLQAFEAKVKLSFGSSSQPGLPEQLGGAAAGISAYSSGIKQLSTAIDDSTGKLKTLIDATDPSDPHYAQLMQVYMELCGENGQLKTFPAAVDGAHPGLDAIAAGLSSAAAESKTARDGDGTAANPGMVPALEQMIAGAQGLSAAVSGYQQVTAGLGGVQSGLQQVIDQGLTPLSNGQDTLVTGLSQLNNGAAQLNTGAQSAYNGSTDLNKGLSELNSGSQKLVDGIWKLSDGSQKLNTGLTDLNSGSDKLLNGLTDANSGSHELYTDLNQGYTQSIEKVSQAKTDKEKPVMANPVEFKEEMIDPVATYGTGFTPYFVPLSLWVGAMAVFLVVPSLSGEEAKKRRFLPLLKEIAQRYLVLSWVGVVQAVVLCSVLIRVLGLQPAHLELFYLFTILLALLSIAIFQMLVYLFGIAGDFIGVILLMLQLTSSGGSYPKETLPPFFVSIAPYLPMTYAVSAFREIISGSQIDVSAVFSLYGAAILILILLTALFKWILSRDAIMIKQPALGLKKVSFGPAIRRLNPLNRLKITNLKLSRGFNLAARHSVKRMRSTRQALQQKAAARVTTRRTALAQKVNSWRQHANRRD
jgi:putative membrane protein